MNDAYVTFPDPKPLTVTLGNITEDGQRLLREYAGLTPESNESRIAACLRFCAGIPTDVLEAGKLADIMTGSNLATFAMRIQDSMMRSFIATERPE